MRVCTGDISSKPHKKQAYLKMITSKPAWNSRNLSQLCYGPQISSVAINLSKPNEQEDHSPPSPSLTKQHEMLHKKLAILRKVQISKQILQLHIRGGLCKRFSAVPSPKLLIILPHSHTTWNLTLLDCFPMRFHLLFALNMLKTLPDFLQS